jgi:hypothetical protein
MGLLVGSTSAHAAWVAVHDARDYVAYVDPQTVSREGDILRMRDLVDLKSPRPSPRGTQHASSIGHSEFDCRNERMRTFHFALHSGQMGNGHIVETPAMSAQWLDLTSGTLLRVLWDFACSR